MVHLWQAAHAETWRDDEDTLARGFHPGIEPRGRAPRAGQVEPSNDEEDRHYAARGLTMMMDGDLDGAVDVFQQIEQKDPDSPLGFVLEANATWWKIYYVSANLIDPDVFDVANMEATPYDSHFDDLDNVAIRKAEARIHQHEDLARSYLYEGYAYALRARLEGLHDRDLPTARAGKKMRSLASPGAGARSQPYGRLSGRWHLQLLCRHAPRHR